MKNRILVTLALTFAASVCVCAQSPLITDPANLAQFPSIEKLRAEMKGTDELDSYARFVAAAEGLAYMIESLKRARGTFYGSPPAAEKIKYQYLEEWNKFTDIQARPPGARNREFAAVVGKYQSDPGFLDSLLVKFFTPKFRADYYAWVQKPIPPRSNSQPPGVTSTSQPQPIAQTPKPTFGPASNPRPKAPEVNVPDHYKLFNGLITMGQPLDVPPCLTIGYAVIMNDDMNCQASEFPEDPTLITFCLSLSSKADWMRQKNYVRLNQGRVERVVIRTVGRKAQDAIIRDLTAKYGPPTFTKTGKVTPSQGNAFDIREPEWNLPGLHVEFLPIERNKFGNYDDIDGEGFVRIETQDAYKRRIEAEKAKKSVL